MISKGCEICTYIHPKFNLVCAVFPLIGWRMWVRTLVRTRMPLQMRTKNAPRIEDASCRIPSAVRILRILLNFQPKKHGKWAQTR